MEILELIDMKCEKKIITSGCMLTSSGVAHSDKRVLLRQKRIA